MERLFSAKTNETNNDDLRKKVEDMRKELFARRITERLSEVREGIALCIKEPVDYYLPLSLLWEEWVKFRTHEAGYLSDDRSDYCDGLKPVPEIARKGGDKGRIVDYSVRFDPPASGDPTEEMMEDRQWIADSIFIPFTYGPTDVGWEWPELQFVGWLRDSEPVNRVKVPMRKPKQAKKPEKTKKKRVRKAKKA